MSAIKEKNAKFRSDLVSAEKRKYFEDNRKMMIQAREQEEKDI